MPHKAVIIDNKQYPSVTEFVKIVDDPKPLIEWAKANTKEYCDKLFEDSAKEGLEFHDGVSKLFSGETINIPSLPPNVQAIHKWREAVGFTDVKTEVYVESRQYLYGGTLDAFGVIDGNIEVVDWKLTSAIRKSHIIQPVAYMQGLKEKYGIVSDRWRIVRPYTLTKWAKETSVEKMKEKKFNTERYKYSFAGSTVYVEEARFEGFNAYWPYVEMCRSLFNFIYDWGQ